MIDLEIAHDVLAIEGLGSSGTVQAANCICTELFVLMAYFSESA